jgi:Ni/Co efflux regulator RcnB
MNVIFTALVGAALVFCAAQAQHDHDRAQETGTGRPPAVGHPGGPQMGGTNRHEAPGAIPNHLRMKRSGELERVGPDRNDFHRGPRQDFDRFHGNFPADRRFHAGPWRPPRGYQYRRWTYGERLPSLYFDPSLWITRFALYGLMAPLPDTVWVRSGPDALLVDRATGEIVRAQYGVFY